MTSPDPLPPEQVKYFPELAYFYGFSLADDQNQIPVVAPVVDHQYAFKSPIFGGELSFRNNLTSVTRDTANFDAISQAAVTGSLCSPTNADPTVKTTTNCLLRGVPGQYTRGSTAWTWKTVFARSSPTRVTA